MPRNTRKYSPKLQAIEKEISRRVELEYKQDVVKHLKSMDNKTTANASMIDQQPELEWYMRPHLLDFLIDSHAAFGLKPETLFLAVNLIDRYCSVRVVYKKHYQLVGCTALWIAAKYEDKARTPSLKDLVSICNNAYEEVMFVQMELHILNTLEWNVGHSSMETFLSMLLGNYADTTVAYIARYLCEVSMYSQSFIGTCSQTIATSAFTLAMIISDQYPTLPSNITQQEIQCISMLSQVMKQPSKILEQKYSTSRTGNVASLVCSYVQRQYQLQTSPSQQSAQFPPTPPPQLHNSSCATPMSTSTSPSVQQEQQQQQKHDLHINNSKEQVSKGFITPPCTPAEEHSHPLHPTTSHPMARQFAAITCTNPNVEIYQSVPMETQRFF